MGTDAITATVTAEDGTTAMAYSIIVTRSASLPAAPSPNSPRSTSVRGLP